MKKLNRKLTLNKKTVSNLDMNSIKGGIPITRLDGGTCVTWATCPTRWYNCGTRDNCGTEVCP